MNNLIGKITTVFTFFILITPSLFAQVTLKEESVDGCSVYRLENARLSLLIDPQRGGKIVSCKDRLGGNVELISEKESYGLAIDHFQSQDFPGELFAAVYKVVDVKTESDQASISLQYQVTGQWRASNDEKIAGLLLEKTFTLSAESPALKCHVRITAPKNESKLFAYWQQSIFFAGGSYDPKTDRSFRPSVRGVRTKTAENNGHTGTEDWIRDFSEGWMTLIDEKTQTGLAVLADYDDLDVLYMCRGNLTMEHIYRQTFMPAGASAEYVTWYIPVAGLSNVVGVTPDYIAGYTLKKDEKTGGEVAFSVVRSVNEPAPLTFKVQMLSVLKPADVKNVGQVNFDAPADQPITRKLAFSDIGSDPLVVRVQSTAIPTTGEKRTYIFEDYYNGTYQWGENIQTDMVSPVYSVDRPRQTIKLVKPEKLELRQVWGDQIWYIEGLMDDYYQLSKAINMIGQYTNTTRRDRNYVSYGVTWRSRLDGFPWDYEKLLSYDLIIFGGVKREALGDAAMEMLGDYMTAGGSMLMLGGPMAYGSSRLGDTSFAEYLPVSFENKSFGLERLNDAEIKIAAPVAFLENLDWKVLPRVQYLHKVKVKDWGKVILHVDGKPFLVIGEKGKQRIACILGAPMGTMEQGRLPFWKWQDWPYLMQQLSWWLMKEDARFQRDTD